MAHETELPASAPTDEPAWKHRAVERSTKAAKLRAEKRVEQFLDTAQTIIMEKGTIDFTVQEVVERSRQSLRSFYQHFAGKHELLLALFEDALRRASDQISAAVSSQSDPLDQLKVAVHLLFELSRPDPVAKRPLFTDFAPQLLISHPTEVKVANEPLIALFAEMMVRAEAAGQTRAGIMPRRMAALTIQTVMFVAQSSGVTEDENTRPITADEVWEFCAKGFASP
jgi:AcrR family transcriptional regulator